MGNGYIYIGKRYTVPVHWLPKRTQLQCETKKATVVAVNRKHKFAVLQYDCGVRECFMFSELEGGN